MSRIVLDAIFELFIAVRLYIVLQCFDAVVGLSDRQGIWPVKILLQQVLLGAWPNVE